MSAVFCLMVVGLFALAPAASAEHEDSIALDLAALPDLVAVPPPYQCSSGSWGVLWNLEDGLWTFCTENIPVAGPVMCGFISCPLLDATLNAAGNFTHDTLCRLANCSTLGGLEHFVLHCVEDLVFRQDVCVAIIANPFVHVEDAPVYVVIATPKSPALT